MLKERNKNMAVLTDHMREVAFDMFSEGELTDKVARRIRQSVESTRSLRANWTRAQAQLEAERIAKRAARKISTSTTTKVKSASSSR